MKTSTSCSALLWLAALVCALAQQPVGESFDCVYEVEGTKYDLSKVYPADEPLRAPGSAGEVVYSPCQELRCDDLYTPKTGDGAVLEMHSDQATNGCNNVWGRSVTATQKPTVTALTGDAACVEEPCGFRVNYYDGDTAVVFRTAEARFICNSAMSSPVPTVDMGNVLTMTVQLDCGSISGGGGMSGGWVFIIILVCVTFVYCVGGFAYNTKVKGTQGAESLPNIDFWRELPGLCTDGVAFCKAKLTGGGESYEEFDEDTTSA